MEPEKHPMKKVALPDRRIAGEGILAILAFHKVGEPSPGGWDTWFYTSEAEFLGYLRALRDGGWRVIDVATFLRGLVDPEIWSRRDALITFDDGYRSALEVAAPLLQRFGYPGIAFVPSSHVGRTSHAFDAESGEPEEPLCTWSELRELERRGVSVQSHGMTHRAFSRLTPEHQEEELRRSRSVLEAGLDKPVEVFAFPFGDRGGDPARVRSALARTGYKAACLHDGLVNPVPLLDPYELSRLPLGRWSDPRAELARALELGGIKTDAEREGAR